MPVKPSRDRSGAVLSVRAAQPKDGGASGLCRFSISAALLVSRRAQRPMPGCCVVTWTAASERPPRR